MGLPITAIAMAASGGAQSPTRFYLLFIIFYASYFYPPREAIPYLVGCVIVHCLPLVYDSGRDRRGLRRRGAGDRADLRSCWAR